MACVIDITMYGRPPDRGYVYHGCFYSWMIWTHNMETAQTHALVIDFHDRYVVNILRDGSSWHCYAYNRNQWELIPWHFYVYNKTQYPPSEYIDVWWQRYVVKYHYVNIQWMIFHLTVILIIVLWMEVCFVENRTILELMPFSTGQCYVYIKFNIAITKDRGIGTQRMVCL